MSAPEGTKRFSELTHEEKAPLRMAANIGLEIEYWSFTRKEWRRVTRHNKNWSIFLSFGIYRIKPCPSPPPTKT